MRAAGGCMAVLQVARKVRVKAFTRTYRITFGSIWIYNLEPILVIENLYGFREIVA
jgi:hypothetical protein